jgi:beta-xylosidase
MVKRDGWYYIFYSGNVSDYHNGSGSQNGALGRQILVDRITWQNNWPSISDGTPSTAPAPWPGLAN